MRKNVIKPTKVLSNQSMGSSFDGPATNVQYLDRIGISINCETSDAIGEFKIQGRVSPSIQDGPALGPASEWVDLDMDTMLISGTDKSIVIDIINTGLIEVRAYYTRTSGDGSCDIWVSAKEV